MNGAQLAPPLRGGEDSVFLRAWGGAWSRCPGSPGRRGAADGGTQAGGRTESGLESRLGFEAFVPTPLIYTASLVSQVGLLR